MMEYTKGENVGFADKYGVWVTAKYVEDKEVPWGTGTKVVHIVDMIPSMTSDMTGLAMVPLGKLVRP
jgi:hypothetical protein